MKWVKQFVIIPLEPFPGHSKMKAAEAEIERLRREVEKLKAEPTARKTYRSRNEASAGVFDDIERFYNPCRSQFTLRYLSPVAYGERMRIA
jgi:transposase InsO family protein